MLYNLVGSQETTRGYTDHFISNVATSLGLTTVELDEVRDYATRIECPIPKDEGARVGYFYHVLFLLRMNGEISKEDQELCRSMGFRLCLNPLMVNELMEVISKYENEEIPEEVMLNTVKRHYN